MDGYMVTERGRGWLLRTRCEYPIAGLLVLAFQPRSSWASYGRLPCCFMNALGSIHCVDLCVLIVWKALLDDFALRHDPFQLRYGERREPHCRNLMSRRDRDEEGA
jgi:hypothetical protein